MHMLQRSAGPGAAAPAPWCRGAHGPGQARGAEALLSVRDARREARLSASANPGVACPAWTSSTVLYALETPKEATARAVLDCDKSVVTSPPVRPTCFSPVRLGNSSTFRSLSPFRHLRVRHPGPPGPLRHNAACVRVRLDRVALGHVHGARARARQAAEQPVKVVALRLGHALQVGGPVG